MMDTTNWHKMRGEPHLTDFCKIKGIHVIALGLALVIVTTEVLSSRFTDGGRHESHLSGL